MEWFERLSTGNQVIDRQHRMMMQCLEDLENAVLQKRPLRIAYTLGCFKDTVLEHLATEEAMMRESSYPLLEQHLAEHDRFRIRVDAIVQRSIQQTLPYSMVEDLAFWLIKHFVHSDRECILHAARSASAKGRQEAL